MWRMLQSSALIAMAVAAASTLGLVTGCRQDMHDQLKLEPLESSPLFSNERGSRDPIAGTVARGQLRADRHLYEGKKPHHELNGVGVETQADQQVDTFPFTVTKSVLLRGQERYDIYCAPCHSRTGKGDGMIVRRGYRKPPPLWDGKIRDATVGHLFDVVTQGFGVMPAYRTQVSVHDRWAIIAYVRALQLAHHAKLSDAPADMRAKLDSDKSNSEGGGG